MCCKYRVRHPGMYNNNTHARLVEKAMLVVLENVDVSGKLRMLPRQQGRTDHLAGFGQL